MELDNNVFLNHENKWVVTDKKYQKVLLVSDTLEELQKEIKEKGIKNAVILYVPSSDSSLAPYAYC